MKRAAAKTTGRTSSPRSRRRAASPKFPEWRDGDARSFPGVAPSFALLREKRRLAVCNPENGVRFTISLRDWEEIIWSVRVYPERKWRRHVTPHTTAHRMMARWAIEDWLEGLRLA